MCQVQERFGSLSAAFRHVASHLEHVHRCVMAKLSQQ